MTRAINLIAKAGGLMFVLIVVATAAIELPSMRRQWKRER